jgi:hypothetical protein
VTSPPAGDWTVEGGPERAGSERVWRVRLGDGRGAVLAQLVPELAREEALRRRYVNDAERLRDLRLPVVAEILAVGPQPEPRDPAADPPWRLRLDHDGEDLESWLSARAPVPVDEAVLVVSRLCDALAEVHERGAVLRDLSPRQIVRSGERIWFADVGLARVDILSSRTASSLLLEGSPYASPEHLRSTRVDARSDLYTVGVILWRALTGTLPFGDGPALLSERGEVPRLSAVRGDVPVELDAIVARCLARLPEERPDGAREVARALRGQGAPGKALAVTTCQACGRSLRAGLRLCVHCGSAVVQFRHDSGPGWALDLTGVKEDAIHLAPLQTTLGAVSQPPLPPLNFLVGDPGMYSKEERKALIALPARLWSHMTEDSARELERRLASKGVKVERRSQRVERRNRKLGTVGMTAALGALPIALATQPLLALLCIPAFLIALVLFTTGRGVKRTPVFTLRDAPAALPTTEPLVKRLLGSIEPAGAMQPDVAEQLTELALLVQRVADRRAELLGGARAEVEAVTAPLDPLVALIQRQAEALVTLDRELATLDEGAMVRALATSEARGEPRSARESILTGLDRLRRLEDTRLGHMQRLLDASSLLRRTVELGLRVVDEETVQRAELERARASLEA